MDEIVINLIIQKNKILPSSRKQVHKEVDKNIVNTISGSDSKYKIE